MSATLSYLPAMLALRAVSRVPLTRHAADGTAPVSDGDGLPVSEVAGVTARPDFAATLFLITELGVVVGFLAGVGATFAAGD
ncbi:hypothetical protein ABNG03_08595 [Halorubrum sp. RMP-47]|uniref:Uncharacterized protein n=1 Tax=Halorubrum miltondacostae TaxID=3076378 RepID=A0ABD5M3Q9_9EURY